MDHKYLNVIDNWEYWVVLICGLELDHCGFSDLLRGF